MKELNIILGHKCNYECSHCVTLSSPRLKESRLSDQEIVNLSHQIKKHSPKTILFTGGEPTLYLKELNHFISIHPSQETASFGLTTNGWFGVSEKQTDLILSKIDKLDFLQVSFDAFHGTETKFSFIKNIQSYCLANKISFNISMALSEPKDLLLAQELIGDLGVKVVFQPVSTAGRAKERGISYKYFEFEPQVLDQKCPNSETLTYIEGRGYSLCCSNLIYNNVLNEICHQDLDEYVESNIYKTLRTKTFSQILQEKNIDQKSIPKECSSVCNLCEYAFGEIK